MKRIGLTVCAVAAVLSASPAIAADDELDTLFPEAEDTAQQSAETGADVSEPPPVDTIPVEPIAADAALAATGTTCQH